MRQGLQLQLSRVMYIGSNLFLDFGNKTKKRKKIRITLQCLNIMNASSEKIFLLFFQKSEQNLYFGVLTYTPQVPHHFQGTAVIYPIQQLDTFKQSLMRSGALSSNTTKKLIAQKKLVAFITHQLSYFSSALIIRAKV